jgi:hypothetical protein
MIRIVTRARDAAASMGDGATTTTTHRFERRGLVFDARVRHDAEARALDVALRCTDRARATTTRYAGAFDGAWIERVANRARAATFDRPRIVDGERRARSEAEAEAVGRLARALRRGMDGGDDASAADAMSAAALRRLRDGQDADDDDGVETRYVLIATEIAEDGTRTRVPLPLDRVDARIAAAAARSGRDETKANEDAAARLRDALRATTRERDEMRRALERRAKAQTRAALKAQAAEAKTKAKIVELEAENEALRENETKLKVKVRDLGATLKSIQRTRGGAAIAAAPVVGRRVGASPPRRSFVDAGDEMLDEIDARLHSLQTFLARAKDTK